MLLKLGLSRDIVNSLGSQLTISEWRAVFQLMKFKKFKKLPLDSIQLEVWIESEVFWGGFNSK